MFNFNIEIITLSIEVWIGNQSQGKQTLTGPDIMLKQQFNKLIHEVGQMNVPAKVRFSQPYYLENGQTIEQSVTFANNKYINEFGEEGVWEL